MHIQEYEKEINVQCLSSYCAAAYNILPWL